MCDTNSAAVMRAQLACRGVEREAKFIHSWDLSHTTVLTGVLMLLTCLLVPPVCGQRKPSDTRRIVAPPPKRISLTTKDQVLLSCVFYAGTNDDQTVPIILVHGWGGVGGEFSGLAEFLQVNFGHAVIVPDLRGHGASVRRTTPVGVPKTIKPDRMRTDEIAGMH